MMKNELIGRVEDTKGMPVKHYKVSLNQLAYAYERQWYWDHKKHPTFKGVAQLVSNGKVTYGGKPVKLVDPNGGKLPKWW